MSLKIIAGFLKGRQIKAPKNIRPATANLRESIFNISSHLIQDANFLDLFAGSGAMGLEALSRGASFSTFIDNNKISISFIKKNIVQFNLQKQSKLILSDALLSIKKLKNPFDIITIDPPFIFFEKKPNYINEILYLISEKDLLLPKGIIFLEEPNYSKREAEISNLNLLNTRKYGSAILSQYTLK